MMDIDDYMLNYRPDFPQWIYDLFPLVVVFYKKNKPKERKRINGYEVTAYEKEEGKAPKMKWKAKKVHYKRYATRQQNNFSYATCCLLAPGDLGTAKRSLKHKGYTQLIAAVYATPEEIEREKNRCRYHFSFYKSMLEFYNVRKVSDPRIQELCETLDREFPSRSSGQLRLH